MKELDVVLVRYLDGEYAGATDAARRAFEALLDWQDPELFACLVGRVPLPDDPELADVLTTLARYRD